MSINKPYRGPQDLPQVIPVFALNGALLLPLGQLPLNIFEPRYMAMIDDAMKADRIIGMVQVLSDAPDKGGKPALYGRPGWISRHSLRISRNPVTTTTSTAMA